jgi:hypothetical protein
MSVNPAPISPQPNPKPRPNRAELRLAAIKRELQALVRRKLKGPELSARNRAAAMLFRHEASCYDAKATSEDIVRLHNAARRAVADYERIVRAGERPKPVITMADLEAELRRHG